MQDNKHHKIVDEARADDLFLPSFCAIHMVFAVVIVAELFAFVLVLAPTASSGDRWSDLGLVSLFVQWLALSSAAVLCVTRPWLSRMSTFSAAVVSYLLLLLVTLLLSEIAYQVVSPVELLGAPSGGDHSGFLLRNLIISALISAMVLRYFYVQHQWKQQIQAESRARVKALQARIRPHFLFNSLNTIASLTSIDARQAESAVQDLADLFRFTMGDLEDRVSLDEELEIARRYLRIEMLRLGERLQVDWTTKNLPLESKVPALLLQPLLENAVYHGIEPLPQGGRIEILGTYNRGVLRLEVRNPLPDSGVYRHGGNHMALDNIEQRLRLAFGKDARLETEQREGSYRVRLMIPLEPTA